MCTPSQHHLCSIPNVKGIYFTARSKFGRRRRRRKYWTKSTKNNTSSPERENKIQTVNTERYIKTFHEKLRLVIAKYFGNSLVIFEDGNVPCGFSLVTIAWRNDKNYDWFDFLKIYCWFQYTHMSKEINDSN